MILGHLWLTLLNVYDYAPDDNVLDINPLRLLILATSA